MLKKSTITIAFASLLMAGALLIAQSGGIAASDPVAKETMDAAIKALGGADKIGGIKSLVLNGTHRRITAPGTSRESSRMTEFEIRMLLPDSFALIKQPANTDVWLIIGNNRIAPGPAATGVSQGKLIRFPPAIVRIEGVGETVSSEQMEYFAKRMEINDSLSASEEADHWSRILTGMLMKAGSAQLTISSSSAPGAFILAKSEGALGEIEFDSKTGYPSIIKYNTPRVVKLPDGGTQVRPSRAGDNEIQFQDRFSVNGIMLPKVITLPKTTTSDGLLNTEELLIEKVLINPDLSLKDFEFQ